MTDAQIRQLIRVQGVRAWNYCQGATRRTISVELKNGPTSGITINGATGQLWTQLHDCASEIRDILNSELGGVFPFPKVIITVDAPYTLPAAPVPPPPPQEPPPPPIINPNPPTTPITPNDKEYYV